GMTAESEGRAAVMVGPEGMVGRVPSDGAGERTVTFGESEPREAEILRQLLDAMAEAGGDTGTGQAEQVAAAPATTLRSARGDPPHGPQGSPRAGRREPRRAPTADPDQQGGSTTDPLPPAGPPAPGLSSHIAGPTGKSGANLDRRAP